MKETIILYFTFVKEQVKLAHWSTFGYSTHQALGSLYEGFDDQIDEFVEIMMGKYGRPEFPETFNIEMYSELVKDPVKLIDGCIDYLISLSDELDPRVDSDLLNKRDEMLGLMNKTKYLLTLTIGCFCFRHLVFWFNYFNFNLLIGINLIPTCCDINLLLGVPFIFEFVSHNEVP